MINPLRSVLDEPRAPSPPARVWWDWLLVGAVAVSALLEVTLREDLRLPWLSLLVTVGLAPTLLWRRTHPFAVVAVAFGTAVVVDVGLIIADQPALDMYTTIYFLLLPYALFRWASGREVLAGLAIILVAATTAFFVSWTGVADLVGGSAVLVTSMALGVAARSQHDHRRRRLEQAKAEERVELARELHDTVAHHVSAIAIQAQAGRALAASSPQSSVEALEVIETEASRTLAEMRAMVRVLRNQSPADYAPQAGVADLERLAGASPAGPRVQVKLSGDVAVLPAAVDAAVFRIAQEAVTNALRHAHNATLVEVRVDGDPSSIRLTVRDDGDHIPGRTTAVRVRHHRHGRAGDPARRVLLGRPVPRAGLAGRGNPAPGGDGVTIRVLVADDQDLVRTGLRLILGTLDGIEVVGEARDGEEAVRLARELRPDVCLMDIRMPLLDGVEATRQLAGPGVEDPVAVVVITTFDLDEYVHGALQAGATGFLLKDAGPEMLGEAIRAATRGDSLISPSITRRLCRRSRAPAAGSRRRNRSTRSPNGRSRCFSPSPAAAPMPRSPVSCTSA